MRRRSDPKRSLMIAAFATVITVTSANAAVPVGTIIGLGDLPGGQHYSKAYGISADGRTVVGESRAEAGSEAFRWTITHGMHPLGMHSQSASSQSTISVARAVSADGTVVVGDGFVGNRRQAFRWTEASGTQLLDPANSFAPYAAHAVSADGSVVAGVAAQDDHAAYRWEANDGFELLPVGPNQYISGVRDMTPDGQEFVGHAGVGVSAGRAVLWNSHDSIQPLEHIIGQSASFANAISADGLTIVGSAESVGTAMDAVPVKWNRSGQATLLPIPSTYVTGQALEVSGDGSLIVGSVHDLILGQSAVVWRRNGFVVPLERLLQSRVEPDPYGWQLWEAVGISEDGQWVIGNGLNPDQQFEAFVMRIPSAGTMAILLIASITPSFSRHRAGVRPVPGTSS